ncbi:hypothetical protein LEP1GSC064_0331 [Leptospira kirschneri serovar Grippotyphosa str. Moskva]|nr:hypothetical protein LEP1GSC064_0331 [Leptospira kirschneri serovar Grippotyphosa str. Moskva]EKR09947.1 hypothetical protein LEP1GSC122_3352 [Leptospira kirschneri serovar Valbuzzi str. 200702274]EMK17140.1 hypothetical protein LEP1GSC042_2835 [Leptospira kirschneri serovar Bim str. PUO 1247]EMN04240.1 hypothetical protein LEP1GSC046_3760 [Leptospira kirschneri serovar Bim str. 1051]
MGTSANFLSAFGTNTQQKFSTRIASKSFGWIHDYRLFS